MIRYAQPRSFSARPAFHILVMCAILSPSNCGQDRNPDRRGTASDREHASCAHPEKDEHDDHGRTDPLRFAASRRGLTPQARAPLPPHALRKFQPSSFEGRRRAGIKQTRSHPPNVLVGQNHISLDSVLLHTNRKMRRAHDGQSVAALRASFDQHAVRSPTLVPVKLRDWP